MRQGGRLAEGDILKLYINDFDEATKKPRKLKCSQGKATGIRLDMSHA